LGYDANTQGSGRIDAYNAYLYLGGYEQEDTTLNVSPGETIIYKYKIKNLGNTKETFRIYTKGVDVSF